MKRFPLLLGAVGLALAFGAADRVQAAALGFDDSDPNTITITAVDFEGGFYVNGQLLQMGLGNPQSITLADGVQFSFSANWEALRQGGPGAANLFFSEAGGLTVSTSYAQITFGSGSLEGVGLGYSAGNAGPTRETFVQGSTQAFSTAFLTGEFISEGAAVPEPASMALLGAGLLGLAAARRRRAG